MYNPINVHLLKNLIKIYIQHAYTLNYICIFLTCYNTLNLQK